MNLIVPLLVIDSPGAGRGQKEQVMKSFILAVSVVAIVSVTVLPPVAAVIYDGIIKVMLLLAGRA